jgi:hypothetical protein
MRELCKSARIFLFSLMMVSLANASIYTLQDQNSIVKIDTTAGMYSWTVDGVNQFYKNSQTTGTQRFWYRVGNQNPESPLETLTLMAGETVANDKLLILVYRDTARNFDIEVGYTLSGGIEGSGSSGVNEIVTVRNYSGTSLDLHFFQYTDFDLNATPNNDYAIHTNGNTIRQSDQNSFFSETVITSVPQHWEIAPYSTTLDKLNDGLATTLSDTTSVFGPTDVTWAFQWDKIVAPRNSFQISIPKNIWAVPEPATITMLVLGGLSFLRRRK